MVCDTFWIRFSNIISVQLSSFSMPCLPNMWINWTSSGNVHFSRGREYSVPIVLQTLCLFFHPYTNHLFGFMQKYEFCKLKLQFDSITYVMTTSVMILKTG
ncbi:unnamed protein product [Lupinus luteus]|uniref:Uncharacterized protein n=1 Tax=Lupinus luteus TaxID=3873 RepID=A0AAV1W3W5_LUPLU